MKPNFHRVGLHWPTRVCLLLVAIGFLYACGRSIENDYQILVTTIQEIQAYVTEHGGIDLGDPTTTVTVHGSGSPEARSYRTGFLLEGEYPHGILDALTPDTGREFRELVPTMSETLSFKKPFFFYYHFYHHDAQSGAVITDNFGLALMKPGGSVVESREFMMKWTSVPGVDAPEFTLDRHDWVISDKNLTPLMNPKLIYDPSNGLDSMGFLYVDFFTQ